MRKPHPPSQFTSNRLLPSCFHTLPQLLFVLCPAHSLRKHTCRLMMPNLAFPLLLVFTKHMSLQLVVFFFLYLNHPLLAIIVFISPHHCQMERAGVSLQLLPHQPETGFVKGPLVVVSRGGV